MNPTVKTLTLRGLAIAAMAYGTVMAVPPKAAEASSCCSQGADCEGQYELCCSYITLEAEPCNTDTGKLNYCRTSCS